MSAGNMEDPMSLTEAAISARIQPGHRVNLLGGVYTGGDLHILRGGTAEAPLTIRNVPGAVARLRFETHQDGSVTRWISEDYGLIRDSVDTNRVSDSPGIDTQANGWHVNGDDCAMINLRIENIIGNGFDWFGHQNGVLYGNIIHSNGWVGSDRAHGPGHYTHNSSYECQKAIKNTVVFNSFRPSMQIGDGGLKDAAYNYIVEDFTTNCRFGAGSTPADNLVVRRLWLSGVRPEFGQDVAQDNGSLLLENCVIDAAKQFHIERFQSVTIRNCVFTSADYTLSEPAGGTTLTLENNRVVSSGQYVNFVPNAYAPRFATLSVFDFDETGSVTIDVSAFVTSGTVRVHNPMLWDEVQDLQVVDGELVLPMTGWTTPLPTGFDEFPTGTGVVFSARFGVFVLEKDF